MKIRFIKGKWEAPGFTHGGEYPVMGSLDNGLCLIYNDNGHSRVVFPGELNTHVIYPHAVGQATKDQTGYFELVEEG